MKTVAQAVSLQRLTLAPSRMLTGIRLNQARSMLKVEPSIQIRKIVGFIDRKAVRISEEPIIAFAVGPAKAILPYCS